MNARTTHKSFRYQTRTTWSSGRRGVLSGAHKPDIGVGSPPEFRGEPGNWSPEELLIASVNTCIMLTFLTLVQGRDLVAYESEVEGLLENVEGKYLITGITVRPRITVKDEAEVERARELIERTEAQCFMSNSVKAKVTIIPEVVAGVSAA